MYLFIFLFPPLACWVFAWSFVKVSPILSFLWVTIMIQPHMTPLSLPEASTAQGRATAGQQKSVNHEVSFKVWKVMPVRKLLKINSPKWLTPGCKKKYYETVTLPSFLTSLWFTLFQVFYTTWCSFDKYALIHGKINRKSRHTFHTFSLSSVPTYQDTSTTIYPSIPQFHIQMWSFRASKKYKEKVLWYTGVV